MSERQAFPRRQFLGGALAAGGAALSFATMATAAEAPASGAPVGDFSRKIKLGIIGCGGRGPWLGQLFKKHGGYQLHAVADYLDTNAQQAGERLGVDKSRRFSGLAGHKRLIESGVEAVVVVNVPRFHADHAYAAIEGGCHVFAAKPVAVDVPRALRVQAAGQLATKKQLCYLVDYQLPTDPVNIEVVRRIHEGGIGRVMHVDSLAISPPWAEPQITSREDRLSHGRWLSSIALSGDVITENSIHSINAVRWLMGRRPISAVGRARCCRRNPRDDYREVYMVTYEFDDGALWTHRCQSLRNQEDWALGFQAFGELGSAVVSYRGKSYLKGGPKHFGAQKVESLYDQGAIRNIATFYDNILHARCENLTVPSAVDDALTATLGREAAARRCCLTMEELLKENKELPFDLSGFQV